MALDAGPCAGFVFSVPAVYSNASEKRSIAERAMPIKPGWTGRVLRTSKWATSIARWWCTSAGTRRRLHSQSWTT